MLLLLWGIFGTVGSNYIYIFIGCGCCNGALLDTIERGTVCYLGELGYNTIYGFRDKFWFYNIIYVFYSYFLSAWFRIIYGV